jgi:hypothetical protein
MFDRWQGHAGPGTALRSMSDAVQEGTQQASESLRRGGQAGLAAMRTLGTGMAGGMRRVRGSGRAAVGNHPLATVVAATLVGAAAGWVLRRALELRAAREERVRARAAERRASRTARAPRKQSANGVRRPSARQIM